MKHVCVVRFAVFAAAVLAHSAFAAGSTVPEPFRGFDAASKYTINYDDLDALLRKSVVNMGRSDRSEAATTVAKTGTRMKQHVQVTTANEGNRFYYEIYQDSDENKQLLHNIRLSLEQVPAEVPLKFFSRDEQLAYWLNLYNVTVLDEIVNVYPKRSLKKYLTGKKSILSQKLLNVAGIPLSLDDIEFTILKQNYDSNPLIIYGLYQGIIGGPNIRKSAYTGENVYRNLEANAAEFINSNRGTYSSDPRVFQVSSLYDRDRAFFGAKFQSELTAHLMRYIQGRERGRLQSASVLKPNINDWTVTDLYGTNHEIGGSLADNRAALIDAVHSSTLVDGKPVTTFSSIASSNMTDRATPLRRISPDLAMHLKELNMKQQTTASANASVTVEELGEVKVDDKDKAENKDKAGGSDNN